MVAARDAGAVKISAAIPAGREINRFALTADGATVVYELRETSMSRVVGLVAVPVAGGIPHTLVDIPLSGAQRRIDGWSITPDGASVVYLSDKDANQDRDDLFCVPIDGSEAPVKLNTAPAPNDIASFVVTDDSTRVVFEAWWTNVIYSVPTSGGTPVALATGTGSFLPRFRVAPDGSRVVYPFDDGMGGGRQIYSVPITGGSATKLSSQAGVFLPGENSPLAARYAITPDSANVLFFAANGQELWMTPIAQATPTQLAGPIAIYFPDFLLTPDGATAVFTAGTYPAYSIYRVPVDGSTAEQPVSGAGLNVTVSDYQMSANGQKLVYRVYSGGKARLYAVSLAGGDDVELTPSVIAGNGAYNNFRIDPTAARVVYVSEQNTVGVIELFSVPIGGGAATLLSKSPMPATGDVDPLSIRIAPDGRTVIFRADEDTDGVLELFSSGIASGGPQKVHPDLAPDGDVVEALFTPDSRTIVYQADQETDGLFEIFAVAAPEPAPTPTPMATRTPVPETGDRCANCIDDDFDGLVDRADPDCPPLANGGGAGVAGTAAKSAAKCGKTLGKLGTSFATKRAKALAACLQKAFACVQAGGDAACLAKAGAACGKVESARRAAVGKIASAIGKSCGDPPVASADLGASSGLGFTAEAAGCADFGAMVGDAAGVAACLAARHACRAEQLVGMEMPRARELLAASGRDPEQEAPCLPDGGGGGAAVDVKPELRCQKALAKAGAAYAAARLKAEQKCADGVFQCVQVQANDSACRAKAEAKCGKLFAKLAAAVTKLDSALAKGCTGVDLEGAGGLGFAARSAECTALGTTTSSVAGVAACIAAQHDCRSNQILIGQTPRSAELGAVAP